MFLETKKSRNGHTMFIFNFETELEWFVFMKKLYSAVHNLVDEIFEGDDFLTEIVDTLNSRISDKYAREGVDLSSFLYADEFCDLAGVGCLVLSHEWSDDDCLCDGCDGCADIDECDDIDECEELPEDWRDRWTEKR